MKRSILITVICLVASQAWAVECQKSPGKGGHWTWRSIDHRKCWYAGHRHLARAQLHWPRSIEPKKIPAPPARVDSSSNMVANSTPSIWESCAPPLAPSVGPPVEPFADRWNDNEY